MLQIRVFGYMNMDGNDIVMKWEKECTYNIKRGILKLQYSKPKSCVSEGIDQRLLTGKRRYRPRDKYLTYI